MVLTADSGSTKTDWQLSDDNEIKLQFHTNGCNPFHMQEDAIRELFTSEVITQLNNYSADDITEVHFFGAGCTKEASPILHSVISSFFPNASPIEVDSDLLGAARALCGSGEGIACILGTGANSCLYNGQHIVKNTPAMGYILGDEGSGAVLGRIFLNALYKGGHEDFIPVFEKETGLDKAQIIQHVYREPLANRFLASFMPFVNKHISEEWIDTLVTENFRLFFRQNILHYNRPDLPVNFVGSVAYFFRKQLEQAARAEGFQVGTILRSPLG